MLRGSLVTVASLLLLIAPTNVLAQDRNLLRTQAKEMVAQLRAAGEPKDRCSLGAFIGDGGVVLRTVAGSRLSPGDRVLAINGHKVTGESAEHFVSALRAIPPNLDIAVQVRRGGGEESLGLTCSNARHSTELLFDAAEAAAAAKFDDCVEILGRSADLGAAGALLKAQCATVSRKSANYRPAQLTFDAMRLQLEDAHWIAAPRRELVLRLRSVEGSITRELGAARYQELIALTKAWPGDETLFEDSSPDWGLFRQKAEAALRGRLIDPESARVDWPFGFTYGSWSPFLMKPIDGYWTCGTINARNRMGGYTGSVSFVAVMDHDGSVRYVEMGDATRSYDLLSTQCANSAKLLPPPQAVPTVAQRLETAPSLSLADELKKLSELRTSGALTEEEFQVAKRRLLEK